MTASNPLAAPEESENFLLLQPLLLRMLLSTFLDSRSNFTFSPFSPTVCLTIRLERLSLGKEKHVFLPLLHLSFCVLDFRKWTTLFLTLFPFVVHFLNLAVSKVHFLYFLVAFPSSLVILCWQSPDLPSLFFCFAFTLSMLLSTLYFFEEHLFLLLLAITSMMIMVMCLCVFV